MKKVKIILLIFVIALSPLVYGCFSGSNKKEEKKTTTENPKPVKKKSGNLADAKVEEAVVNTDKPNVVNRALQYTKDTLPPDFEKAIDGSFIVVVGFYNSTDYISNNVKDKVEQVVVIPDYRDNIKYFAYTVDENTTPEVGRLTSAVEAGYLPHITIIDGDKTIVFEDSGFTDIKYIEHALYNTVFNDESSPEAKQGNE